MNNSCRDVMHQFLTAFELRLSPFGLYIPNISRSQRNKSVKSCGQSNTLQNKRGSISWMISNNYNICNFHGALVLSCECVCSTPYWYFYHVIYGLWAVQLGNQKIYILSAIEIPHAPIGNLIVSIFFPYDNIKPHYRLKFRVREIAQFSAAYHTVYSK